MTGGRPAPYTVQMNSHKKTAGWRRMIACVRVDTFGIAVERMDNPLLQDRPVALLHGEALPLVTEASAEACLFGLKPGMDWATASAACPGLARVVARPGRYAEASGRLLAALAEIGPELEAFAPGEAFIDLTPCQAYYRFEPERVGRLIHDQVAAACGLSAAVGISGDKTSARWAAGLAGPGVLEVIPPDRAEARLAPLTLAELCGAGPGILEFLANLGVHTCGDMKKIPIALPAQRFGNLGRRLWLMAQGQDPSPVRPRGAEAVHPGLGRLLPPGCQEAEALLAGYRQLAEKLLLRLQRDGEPAHDFRIRLRAPEGWRQEGVRLPTPGEASALHLACRRFLRRHWFGEVVRQIQIQPLPGAAGPGQADFFLKGRLAPQQRAAGRKIRA